MRAIALFSLLLVALALVGSAEAAEPPANHPFLGRIAPETPPHPEPLKDACGVAVDSGGQLFVSSYYDHSVYLFTFNEKGPKWEWSMTIPIPVLPPMPSGKPSGPCDLAVDSAGNLYVNNWHGSVVELAATGPTSYAPAVIVDPNPATGIAIDPATGNLLVDNRTYIAEYAAPINPGDPPVRTIGSGGSIENGYSVAVSSFPGNLEFPGTAGRIYVADAADGLVKVFDPSVSLTDPVEVIDGDGTPQVGFNDLADTDLAVDPLDGHLYVVDNLQPGFERPEAVVDELSSLGRYRGSVPPQVASGHESGVTDAEPSSLAIDGVGNIYLSSGNYFFDGTIHQDADVQWFGPAAKVTTRILTVSKSGLGAGNVFSSDPPGLRCGTACEGEFVFERSVILTPEPVPHNRFAGWSGCPDEIGEGRCVIAMDTNHSVGAEFVPIPQRQLSVTTTGSGAGSVVSFPAGIVCSGPCDGEFDEGSGVTLTATAGAASNFATWRGCDSEPAVGICRVTMSAARSVFAEFDRIVELPPPSREATRHVLSVASTALGGATGTVTSAPAGINCGSACASLYADGTAVNLVARPGVGSTFVGWGGCDSAAADRCTVRLGADRTIVATFGPGSAGPLRLGKLTVRGTTAVLQVRVRAAGELSAASRLLAPTSELPLRAGIVAMRLKLNGAGARAFSRSKHHRLAVPIALTFRPFEGGTPVQAKKTIVFGGRAGQGGRRAGGKRRG